MIFNRKQKFCPTFHYDELKDKGRNSINFFININRNDIFCIERSYPKDDMEYTLISFNELNNAGNRKGWNLKISRNQHNLLIKKLFGADKIDMEEDKYGILGIKL